MASRRWTASTVSALLCAAWAGHAWAETRIFVQNNTPHSFDVTCVRGGEPLADKEWGQKAKVVPPFAKKRKVLSFARWGPIDKGNWYYFTTKLTSPTLPVPIYLKQAVHGTTTHSHLWQSLSLGAPPGAAGKAVNHGWSDDRKTHVASVQAGGVALTVKYRAYFTGGDDDIEYILQQFYNVPTAGPHSLNLLSYNIYMRPMQHFLLNGQLIRAKMLPQYLRGYDAIVFCEAFDAISRKTLLSGLKSEYPHASKVLGEAGVVQWNGGVLVVSRWPIVAQATKTFGKVCSGGDCMADKGVLYVCINKQGRRYHIFGSHTQAWAEVKSAQVRAKQLQIIKNFIDGRNIPAAEPVLIAGDLNVDMKARPDQPQEIRAEYNKMLQILNAAHPQPRGHGYTWDPTTNDLAAQPGRQPVGTPPTREFLDYALYSKAHLKPSSSHNEVRVIRSGEEWKEFFWETAMWDLSDHYAVFGRFDFPLPPPERGGPDAGTGTRHRAPPAPDGLATFMLQVAETDAGGVLKPVPSAQVSVSKNGAHQVTAAVAADGRYAVKLMLGTYRLHGIATGYAPAYIDVTYLPAKKAFRIDGFAGGTKRTVYYGEYVEYTLLLRRHP